MTPNTALRLTRYFGNTPAFWMNLQLRWDLYFAQQEEKQVLEGIQPYKNRLQGNCQHFFHLFSPSRSSRRPRRRFLF